MSKTPWTNGQRECMNEFQRWYRTQNKQSFEYDGPAGTGKTTIMPEMISKSGLDIEEEVLFMAYTGKAASNLSLKGLTATSMHSALMDAVQIPKKYPDGRIIYKNGRPITTWSFQKKQSLPKNIKLMVFDEGTFINHEMGEIAESFGIPICVAGDIHQLGPIFGKPYFLNSPDYSLTEITRQAKDSGIIELATRIRLGKELPNRKYMFKKDAFVIPKREISDILLENSDIIICGKNKTRNYFNQRIRKDILGITSKLPVKGDKIICRNNYWSRQLGGIPLVNGIIGSVLHDISKGDINVKDRTAKLDFQPDYIHHDYYDDLPVDLDFFAQECGSNKEVNRYNRGVKMELGYAITTHLSQGSEFGSVLFWDEVFGDDEFMKRLRYTGATRAKQMLMYAI